MSLVRAEKLVKTYRSGEVEVQALRGVDFAIEAKSFVAFVGPSGSGKSTLLNMIGCLDHPTSGKLTVLDTDVGTLDRRAAADFRGQNIGFVFQDFNLIPVLTVYENIEYPLIMVQNWPERKRRAQITRLLEAVGMAGQAGKRPDQISGGQKQRVAVARALATDAKLVLADEPTANLDHDTAYRVIELMKKMRDELGTTFVFSTHDPKIMGEAEVIFTLEDGRIRAPAGTKESVDLARRRRPMLNILKIAARNLARFGRRTLLTSSLITLGIVGVLLFIAVSGSFKTIMIGQFTDAMLGHLEVHRKGYVASIDSLPLNLNMQPAMVGKVEQALGKMDSIEAYSERIKLGAMFSNFTETTNIRISGVDPAKEIATTPLLPGRLVGEKRAGPLLKPGEVLIPELIARGHARSRWAIPWCWSLPTATARSTARPLPSRACCKACRDRAARTATSPSTTRARCCE